jgi:hypothetical protein
MKSLLRSPLFGVCAGLALATALIASTYLASRTWLSISSANIITVTGAAQKSVTSDLAVWRGAFSTENSNLLEAQRQLKEDRNKVEVFLNNHNATPFVVQPIQIEEIRSRDNDQNNRIVAYRLRQNVEIQSTDIPTISSLGTQASELVEQGVAFVPYAPEFIFTRIAEAKLELLAEATTDAKARAEQMARQGGRDIKQLRSAKMGVFQITPPYSTETSWDGINDRTTVEKSIRATVSASFLLE